MQRVVNVLFDLFPTFDVGVHSTERTGLNLTSILQQFRTWRTPSFCCKKEHVLRIDMWFQKRVKILQSDCESMKRGWTRAPYNPPKAF